MTLRATALAAALSALLCGGDAYAQDQIDPDRPDITNGARTVQPGALQVELGGLYTRASDTEHSFGSPVAFRFGVTNWLEGRVETDGLLISNDGIAQQSGIGDTRIGAKLRLWASPAGAPVLSVLPAIGLPTADEGKGLGTGDADFTTTLLTGSDLGNRWHADANYGLGSIGGGNGRARFLQQFASMSTSVAATDTWTPYVEGFWVSSEDVDGGATGGMDGGVIYALNDRMVLDGGLQIGRRNGRSAFGAFGGLSLIVGKPRGGGGAHERSRQHYVRSARRPRASTR